MRIRKVKDRVFEVSSSRPGKWYSVDLGENTCTCPHFRIRCSKIKAMCKHLIAVHEKYGKKLEENRQDILDKVKKEGEYDIIWLMEEFSEEEVQELIDRGDLIEEVGKVKVLE